MDIGRRKSNLKKRGKSYKVYLDPRFTRTYTSPIGNKYQRVNQYSQVFVKSERYANFLLDRMDLDSNDTILEIGAGKGIITRTLSTRVEKVLALEVDKQLIPYLEKQFGEIPNISIIYKDIMKYTLPSYKYKVVANIPFNMTSKIVRKLTIGNNIPDDSFLIVERVAYERYSGVGRFGNTQMSIILFPWFKVSKVCNIPSYIFKPLPSKEIVLMHIERREVDLIPLNKQKEYIEFIIFGFNQSKKTLYQDYNKVFTNNQLLRIDRNLKIRHHKPSNFPKENWVKLYKLYDKFATRKSKRGVEDYFAFDYGLKRKKVIY